jgi:hypothetical protein
MVINHVANERLLSAFVHAQGPSADDLRACLRIPLDAAAARLGCRPSALIRACRCARARRVRRDTATLAAAAESIWHA